MTDQHPITPPQWQMDAWQARIETMGAYLPSILLEVAQWGYEQHEKELRVASAEASGVELNSKSSPNDFQIRSSDITPPPELVEQWWHEAALRKYSGTDADKHVTSMAAQWGADRELKECCVLMDDWGLDAKDLKCVRRPNPQTLNSVALQMLGTIERDQHYLPEITDTIRRALEALPDND